MNPRIHHLPPALAIFNVLLLAAVSEGASWTNYAVVSWGYDNQGQTSVPSVWSNVTAVAAGAYQSLALNNNGAVGGWGWNFYGQVTAPSNLNNVLAVAAGDAHSLALQNNGTVAAWGWNGFGQASVPSNLSNVTAVAAGGYHSLALKSNGRMAAWGYNGFDQANVPANLSNITAVAAGGYHNLALLSNGTVVAWGDTNQGQTSVPSNLSNVTAVAAGGYHSLALKRDGTVAAWGDNSQGQSSVPAGLTNVTAVAAGFYHSLALKSDGTVVAWGDNAQGQTSVPAGLNNVTALAAGPMASHVLVIQRQVVSPAVLTATRAGGNVEISWPSPSTDWTLQQSSNLLATNWATTGSAISDNGTNKSITISPPTGDLFFRLKFIAVPIPAGGPPATYYVATNGSNAWSGTLPAPNTNNTDGPWATFDHARTFIRTLNKTNTVTVQFRAGTYYLTATEAFASTDSGTSNAPIIYENYPGETPVISGGKTITGWAPSPTIGGAWQASVAGFTPFEQLWVNGQRRYRAQAASTNASGYFYNLGPIYVDCACGCSNANYAQGYSPSMLVTSGTNAGRYECFDRFFFNTGDINPGWSGLANTNHPIEIIDFEDWTIARMRLQSIGSSAGIAGAPSNSSVAYLVGATVAGDYWGFLPEHRYLIDAVKDVLSSATPGQWCVDLDNSGNPSEITYVPAAGEDFTNQPPTVVAPQIDQLITAGGSTGFRYVTFRGLTFSHANWVAGSPGYKASDGAQNEQQEYVPAALSLTNAGHVTLDSVVVAQTGGWGVSFVGIDPQFTVPAGLCSCAASNDCNNEIINSEFTDLGSGSIRLGTAPGNNDADNNVAQYNLVYNNVIAGGDRMLPGNAVVIGNSHHNTISDNEIYDFYSHGVELGQTLNFDANNFTNCAHDNQITFNHIHQIGQGVTSDLGFVHTACALATGNLIADNCFHDMTHDPDPGGYGGWGIYLDQGSSFVIVTNNLVYNTSATGFTYNHSESGTYQLNGTPNLIQNNIFAFGVQASLHRNGDDGALNFNFRNNIVYWDQTQPVSTPPSPQIGTWTCDGSTTSVTNCFELAENMYYSTVDTNMTTWRFILGGGKSFTLAQWQAAPSPAEDFGSTVNADPLFVCPGSTAGEGSYAYNFNLQSNSPAPSLIHFQPFNPSQAGRANPALLPPDLPPAFPLQLLESF
jgi:hypothetical protein